MTSPRLTLAAVCLPLLIAAGGCAEATIATAGTIAGITATGISTGADVFRMGKLDSVDLTSFEQWIDALRAAANDLGMKIERQELYAPGKWRCTLADERGTRLRVYVERRTKTLCRTRIDVGVFGSEPTARLLLARIRQHEPATQPAGAELPRAVEPTP